MVTDGQFLNGNGSLVRQKDHSRTVTVASCRFVSLPFVKYDVVWLDGIPSLPDHPFPGGEFLFPVRMQVFGIFVMVPADPSVRQVFSPGFLPGPSIDVSCNRTFPGTGCSFGV